MNVVALYLELFRVDLRPGDVVKTRILHVNDASAVQANQVVMLVELGVEARRRAGMTGFGHQAEGHEITQDAMHRHARNLGELTPDGAVKLVGGRMVRTVQDRLKDGAALCGDRQPTLLVCREELRHPLLLFCRAHVASMIISSR